MRRDSAAKIGRRSGARLMLVLMLAIALSFVVAQSATSQPPSRFSRGGVTIPKTLRGDFDEAVKLERQGKLPEAAKRYEELVKKAGREKKSVRAEILGKQAQLMIQMSGRNRNTNPDAKIRDKTIKSFESALDISDADQRRRLASRFAQIDRKRRDHALVAKVLGKYSNDQLGRDGAFALAQAYDQLKSKEAFDRYYQLAVSEPHDVQAVNSSFDKLRKLPDGVATKAEEAKAVTLTNELIKNGQKWMVTPSIQKLLEEPAWARADSAQDLLGTALSGADQAYADIDGKTSYTEVKAKLLPTVSMATVHNGKLGPAARDIQKVMNGIQTTPLDHKQAVAKFSAWTETEHRLQSIVALLRIAGDHFTLEAVRPDAPNSAAKSAVGSYFSAWLLDERDGELALSTAQTLVRFAQKADPDQKTYQAFWRHLTSRKLDDERLGNLLIQTHLVLGDWQQNKSNSRAALHWAEAARIQQTLGIDTAPGIHERLALDRRRSSENRLHSAVRAWKQYMAVGDTDRGEWARLLVHSLNDRADAAVEEPIAEKVLDVLRRSQSAVKLSPELRVSPQLTLGPPGVLFVADAQANTCYMMNVTRDQVEERQDWKLNLQRNFQTLFERQPAYITDAVFDAAYNQLFLSGMLHPQRTGQPLTPFVVRVTQHSDQPLQDLLSKQRGSIRFQLDPSKQEEIESRLTTAYAAGHLFIIRTPVEPIKAKDHWRVSSIEVVSLLTGTRRPPVQVRFFDPVTSKSERELNSFWPVSATHFRDPDQGHLMIVVGYGNGAVVTWPVEDLIDPTPGGEGKTIAVVGARPRQLFASRNSQLWIRANSQLIPCDLAKAIRQPGIKEPVKGVAGPLGNAFDYEKEVRAVAPIDANRALALLHDPKRKLLSVNVAPFPKSETPYPGALTPAFAKLFEDAVREAMGVALKGWEYPSAIDQAIYAKVLGKRVKEGELQVRCESRFKTRSFRVKEITVTGPTTLRVNASFSCQVRSTIKVSLQKKPRNINTGSQATFDFDGWQTVIIKLSDRGDQLNFVPKVEFSGTVRNLQIENKQLDDLTRKTVTRLLEHSLDEHEDELRNKFELAIRSAGKNSTIQRRLAQR